jgi:hypothetical protein
LQSKIFKTKTKTFNQIKDIPNSFIVSDDIEIGHKNKIPQPMAEMKEN